MLRVENLEVAGIEPAIRGMRNPMNSWDRSDSSEVVHTDETIDGRPLVNVYFNVGQNDRKLMHSLAVAGPEHRKFMRMIVIYMDITAPLYWWKQFDTYKVGTVSDGCSTMHKLMSRELTLDDFSHEDMGDRSDALSQLSSTISVINTLISNFRESNDDIEREALFRQCNQLMPQSYNQRRTVMLSYEALRTMYHQRKSHKLREWRDFCEHVIEGVQLFDDCIA